MANRKSKKKRIELGISCMLNTEVSSVLALLRRPTADPTATQFLSQEEKKLRHRAVGAGEPSLITRDLLGGGGSTSSAVGGSDDNEFQELDLDVQVPAGWEKRLDLKTGEVYLHRSNASSASPSSSSDHHRHKFSQTFPKLQDLNFPPSPLRITLNLFDESSLELKLTAAVAANYQSVCTLDKFKSALERAERDPVYAAVAGRKRFPAGKSSLSPSYSSSSLFLASGEEETEEAGSHVERIEAAVEVGWVGY